MGCPLPDCDWTYGGVTESGTPELADRASRDHLAAHGVDEWGPVLIAALRRSRQLADLARDLTRSLADAGSGALPYLDHEKARDFMDDIGRTVAEATDRLAAITGEPAPAHPADRSGGSTRTLPPQDPATAPHPLVAFLEARIREDEARAVTSRDKREAAVKRAILREHPCETGIHGAEPPLCRTCCDTHPWTGEREGDPYPCPTVRHLAAVYEEHPDHRDEWAPYTGAL